MIDLEKVKEQAQKEIEEEDYRIAVEEMKEKLRRKLTLWDRLFPWKIIIVKKEV